MAKLRILVVDDEEGMLEVCRDVLLRLPDAEVILERDPLRAADRLTSESIDLLVSDVRMPRLNGVELLRIARQHDEDLPVLMLTAFPTLDSAVESMRLGAADYISKPFLPDDLLAAARRLLRTRRLEAENRFLQRHVERPYSFDETVGESAAMREVFQALEPIAAADVDVLIVGATGTGKELVARRIHSRSRRAQEPFVPVDCGAIPDNLLESEFFGYEKGAFTDALRLNIGLMEFTDGGTLFLDEVAELPLRLQAKLLRALQERSFRRLGGNREVSVDIRVIAATNRDLEKLVKERCFREDLYYRINVTKIKLPLLCERRDDIPRLLEHFACRYAREMNRPIPSIDQDVMEICNGYSWPGNVRELQNVIKGALALGCGDQLTVDFLPDELVGRAMTTTEAGPGEAGFFELRAQRTDGFERTYLTKLLTKQHGDATKAAKEARIPRGTLYRLLKKHGLVPEDYRL